MQRPKRPGRYPDIPPLNPNGCVSSPDNNNSRVRYKQDPRCEFRRVIWKCTLKNRNSEFKPGGYAWRRADAYPVPQEEVEIGHPPRPGPPPPYIPPPVPSTSAPSDSSNATTNNPRPCSPEKKQEVISRLLSILECPVCLEYVTPPILQCREGHLVCSSCIPRLDLCPKCRQPFSDIRARALEQVAEVIPYPCYYSGCTAMLLLSERQAHEVVCPYRQYPCFVEPCVWAGRRSHLPDHMTEFHPNHLVKSHTHELSLTITQQANEEKTFMMQCFDELFHCVMGVDGQLDIFVGFVMYLGAREKASDYEFELKFKRDTPPFTSVSVVRSTMAETPSSSGIGINGGSNAVVVSFSTLREVIQDNGSHSPVLTVYITVRKRDSSQVMILMQEDPAPHPSSSNN